LSDDTEVTAILRCPFCLTLNTVDVSRAAEKPTCGDCGKPILLDRPVKVTAEDFDRTVLGASVPVLVDFYADWCGPCKIVAPLVDEIAGAHTGALLVAKVDSDRAQDIVQRLEIRGVPTIILFEGGEEMARSVGFEPEKLKEMVAQVVGTSESGE
jgi:thioredoxin 2